MSVECQSPCHTKPCFYCVDTELFKSPEHCEIASKSSYFSRKRAYHSVLTATIALQQSSHGVLSHFYLVRVGILCDLTMLSRCLQCVHCAFTTSALSIFNFPIFGLIFTDFFHQKEDCIYNSSFREVFAQIGIRKSFSDISVQMPLITTAFAKLPLCTPACILLRRLYCAAIATIRQPHCTLLEQCWF